MRPSPPPTPDITDKGPSQETVGFLPNFVFRILEHSENWSASVVGSFSRFFYQLAPGAARLKVGILIVLGFGALLVLLQLTRPPRIVDNPGDIFITLSASERMAEGQVPHRDFYSPLGSLNFYLARMARPLGLDAYETYFLGVYSTSFVLCAWGAFLFFRRFPIGLAILNTAFIGFLTVNYRVLGAMHFQNTIAMQYNRTGEALLFLSSIALFVPAALGRSASSGGLVPLELIVSGAFVGLLFFLKINFFVIGLGLLAAYLLLSNHSLLRKSIPLISCAATLAVYLSLVPFSASQYLHDLAIASGSQNLLGRVSGLTKLVGLMPETALVIMLWSHALKGSRMDPPAKLRAILTVMTVYGAGCLSQATNTGGLEEPMFTLAGLMAFIPMLEARRTAASSSPQPPPWFSVAVLLLLALYSKTIAIDAASMAHKIAYNTLHPSANDPSFAILQNNPYPNLRFGGESHSYVMELNSGVDLIRSKVPDPSQDRIAAVAFSNPFPILLGARYPSGDALWWHESINYSRKRYPDPAMIWADATLLIEERTARGGGLGVPEFTAFRDREFKLIGENHAWRLYRHVVRGGKPLN